VVGYTSGHSRGELERQAAAIQRACREREWTLARVVRDHGSREPNALERPGLSHALTELREGAATRLVVDKLEHLGGSPVDLKAMIQWCANNDADLVALDVGDWRPAA
jgi:DNA invertase Pin-like site-specific DNA recombinase